MSSKAPCLNCIDRHLGCHSTCQKEDYLASLELRRRIKDGIETEKQNKAILVRYEK